MNKGLIPLIIFLTFVLIPSWAMAESIEGIIQGFNCVAKGQFCPVDKEDPVIAIEKVFVLLIDSGDYYFIPNLDRAMLARHIRQKVRVTGDINKKYKSIKANSFEVMEKGTWKKTWSKEMEEELRRRLLIDPLIDPLIFR